MSLPWPAAWNHDLSKSIAPPMITIEGIVEHITFHNDENHYTIARFKTAFPRTTATIVGYLPRPRAGESLRLTGQWTTHPRYGQQFAFDAATILLPATIDGIRGYLCSGVVSGIGPSLAEKIIDQFGEATLSVIAENPAALVQVSGIGEKKAARIHRQWQDHRRLADIMNFLQEHGVPTRHAPVILKTYGDDALAVLGRDPYRLAKEISGIGFAAADRMARSLHLVQNEFERAGACIRHLLTEALADGHVYLSRSGLLAALARDFDINASTAEDSMGDLVRDGEIQMETFADQVEDPAVYLKSLWRAEEAIARRLEALSCIPLAPPANLADILAQVENRLILSLSPEQREILSAVAGHRVCIITGGPGTGKTTLIRSMTEMNRRLGRMVRLSAPTGRAARRLADVTGHKALTLHKLLEYNFEAQTFGKTPDNPIEADILIIDEASMVDTALMHQVMSAMPFTASLILVGDAHQLPPVGPGNVLADLIASKAFPVFCLTAIFRQAAESRIIINAHHVRGGEFPTLQPFTEPVDPGAEFYFLQAETPEQAVDFIVTLCRDNLPGLFRFDPVADIQVLSPIHKGVAGTINLNRRLQAALNPAADGVSFEGREFKSGDKVMHLKNNYPKEVFNGDIGVITGVDGAEGLILVDFDGREVVYAQEELSELALGYAISVHKSQGSEYPAVVMPLLTQHYIMLQRNLLYTAITRARRCVVLVGSRKALARAVQNNTPQLRNSGLALRLAPGTSAQNRPGPN